MVQSIEQYKFVSIVVNDIIEERNKHRARVGDKKEIEEKEAEAINNEAANTTGVNPNPLSRSTDKKANFLCMSMAAEPFILRQSKDVEKPEGKFRNNSDEDLKKLIRCSDTIVPDARR